MMNWLNNSIALLALSVMFSVGPTFQAISSAQTAPTKDSKTTKTPGAKANDPTAAPTDKEIADAKAKGDVWVNLSSKIYHKDGKFYGKTKRGKFMSEDEAKKAGYHEAKTETAPKAKAKTGDTKPK